MEIYARAEFEERPGMTAHKQFKELQHIFVNQQRLINENNSRFAHITSQVKFICQTLHKIKNEIDELRRANTQLEKRLVEPGFKRASEL